MDRYSLDEVDERVVLRNTPALLASERTTSADFLAHIATIDARKLYLPASYSSTLEYCLGELKLARDAALKRIRAARTARAFPAIFPAVADGRLNLTAVLTLKPHLDAENVDELIEASAGK